MKQITFLVTNQEKYFRNGTVHKRKKRIKYLNNHKKNQ